MRLWPAYACLTLALVGCEPAQEPEPPVSSVTVPEYVDTSLTPSEVIAEDAGPRRPRPARRADIPASEMIAAPETGVDLGWGWRSTQGTAVCPL